MGNQAEKQGKKYYAYPKETDPNIIILEKNAKFLGKDGSVEIQKNEIDRLKNKFSLTQVTVKELNALNQGLLRKIFRDQLKEDRKEKSTTSISNKKLKKQVKLAEKLAQENIDRQVLLSKLASLKAFDKTSKEFQADLMRLISGSGISTSLIANIYNKQNRRQYLDPIYETARKDDYALYTQLKALENACIVVDNQGNYSYQKPYYAGNPIYPGQRNPKTGPQGKKKNVVVDFVKKGLDYTKMTEAQKEGWSNAAFIGGAGLGLFMIGKWLFTKGKDGKGMSIWGKLGTMAAVVFGTQALTGMNPLELISKAIHGEIDFSKLYSGTASQYDKLSDDMKKQSHGYLSWTMAPLFGGMTLGELHKYVKNKDGKRILPDWKNNFKKKILGEGDKLAISRAKDVNQDNVDDAITKTYELLGIKPGEKLPDAFKDMKIEKITRLVEENKNTINKVMKEKNISIKDTMKFNLVFGNLILNNGKSLDEKQIEEHINDNPDNFVPNFEKVSDLDNKQRKDTIDAMKVGDELVFKIDDQEVKLSKENSNLRYLKSFKGQHIRKINANDGSINGLENQGNPIKFIDSKTGETDYKDLFETAHKFNILERSLTGKVAVGNTPFVLEGKDIVFKESVQGGKVNEIKVFDGSYFSTLSDFPKALEYHEQSVVDYLNKHINTTPTTKKSPEEQEKEQEKKKKAEELKKMKDNVVTYLSTGTGLNLSVADIKYDENTKRLEVDKVKDENMKSNAMVGALEKVFNQKPIYQSEPVDQIYFPNVTFGGKYTLIQLQTITGIENVVCGDQFEKNREAIKYVLKHSKKSKGADMTLKEIQDEYKELMESEQEKLQKKILDDINTTTGLSIPTTDLTYDMDNKSVVITGLTGTQVDNKGIIESLGKLLKQRSRIDPRGEMIEKIALSGVEYDIADDAYPVEVLKAMVNNQGIRYGESFEQKRKAIEYVVNHDKVSDVFSGSLGDPRSWIEIENAYLELLKTDLEKIHTNIENILNEGVSLGFSVDTPGLSPNVEYDLDSKTVKIKNLNETNIQNDQLFTNLEVLVNQNAWYNPFGSELVENVEIENIDFKPGNTISMNYLEKMVELEGDGFTFSGWFSQNREMVERVVDGFDAGDFYSKEKVPLDRNSIILLDEIYANPYDFNGWFDEEDDSRIDFVLKVADILKAEGKSLDVVKQNMVNTKLLITSFPKSWFTKNNEDIDYEYNYDNDEDIEEDNKVILDKVKAWAKTL